MDQYEYINKLEIVMLAYAEENLSVICNFQHNDTKHSARWVTVWLQDNHVDVLQ